MPWTPVRLGIIFFGFSFEIIFVSAPGVRVRETGGDHTLVELSGPRQPNKADVVDDVLIQSLEFRVRNQITALDNKVLRQRQTVRS